MQKVNQTAGVDKEDGFVFSSYLCVIKVLFPFSLLLKKELQSQTFETIQWSPMHSGTVPFCLQGNFWARRIQQPLSDKISPIFFLASKYASLVSYAREKRNGKRTQEKERQKVRINAAPLNYKRGCGRIVVAATGRVAQPQQWSF